MNENSATRRRPDPSEAWLAWEPTNDDRWDLTKVLRLHRRAGLGATWSELNRDLAEGHEAALSRMLNGNPTGPDGRPAEAIDAFCDAMSESYRGYGGALDSIRQAWLYRLVFTPRPLRERMILAWHDHYATSETKVTSSRPLIAQHATQRRLWRSRIGELHLAMLRDEAMLTWLDGPQNHRAAPNENLAREFLELFALGRGNYREADVRETARALTGWQRVYNVSEEVRYVPSLHDAGEKTILDQTGRWGEEDVVRIACAHPAAARRIAWRLWRTFISNVDEPSDELLEGLASVMRVEGDVDVARGMETLVRSRLFHGGEYAGRRVLGPVEWVAGILRLGETFPPHPDLAEVAVAARQMGQRLFRPPNVAGWPGGLEWLGGASLVARQNFAAWLPSDESSVEADHWSKLVGPHQGAGGETELDFWTALFWGRLADAGERQKLSAPASENDRAKLVRVLLSSPAAYLA